MKNKYNYYKIKESIRGLEDLTTYNAREIGEDQESDFAKFIIQQNEWFRTAIDTMYSFLDGMDYSE